MDAYPPDDEVEMCKPLEENSDRITDKKTRKHSVQVKRSVWSRNGLILYKPLANSKKRNSHIIR